MSIPRALVFLLCGIAPLWPQERASFTLAQAVKIALERHPDTAKARAASDGLRGKIREVRAQALPEINIIGGGLRMRDPSFLNSSSLDKFPPELVSALDPVGSNLFSYAVTVKQPLYTAGKVGNALKVAGIEAEGALAEIDRSEQDLALAVVKAWYGLLWAGKYYENVSDLQKQREQHAAMARVRHQNGVATEVDVLRSDVAVANGQPELVRARNAIRQARALLNFYLVRQVDEPAEVDGTFPETPWENWDVQKLAVQAYRSRPELVRLRVAERSAAMMLNLARSESRLRADFYSEYGVMSRLRGNLLDPRFLRWNIGASVTVPVFDGFKRSGLTVQANANRRVAQLDRERLEQQVSLQLRQALDEMRAAEETVTAARANIAQADRVLTMMQANYRYGAATTLDIMDAQTALATARTNLLRGLHDASIARATLRWTMGQTPWE